MNQLKLLFIFPLLACACATDADDIGIAAECSDSEDCPTYVNEDGDEENLTCLTQFTSGYCGMEGCDETADCPEGGICVAHDDGSNYCFRVCQEKTECNANRSADSEANCSANFDWATAGDDDGSKACIPPSSGT